jgi:hypothetical protein
VKRKKSGRHRLQLIAKDSAIAPDAPCEQDGELVVEAVGAGTPPRRFPLEAAFWKPIKAKKPERGCKYRKGPVVATVQMKAGKMLKVVANGDDLGVPLATDPRPVRLEVRHGDARVCLEFGGTKGRHTAGKKLLAKNAAPATVCPASPADEGLANTLGVGTCAAGLRACVDGIAATCTGQVLPGDASCDGADDDCDGQTDEGCP